MLLLIILVILILGFPAVGYYSPQGQYLNGGFGIGAILAIVLLYLLLSNSHYVRI